MSLSSSVDLCISNAYKGSLRSEMSFSSRKVLEGAKPLKEDSPVHQFPFSFLKTAGRLRVTDSVPWGFGEECELPITVEGSGSSKGAIAGSSALFGINQSLYMDGGRSAVWDHWRVIGVQPLVRSKLFSIICLYQGRHIRNVLQWKFSADRDGSWSRFNRGAGNPTLLSRNAANGTFSLVTNWSVSILHDILKLVTSLFQRRLGTQKLSDRLSSIIIRLVVGCKGDYAETVDDT